MSVLLLGKGVANDGVELLLKEDNIDYEYLNINEVKSFEYDYVVKAPGIPCYEEVIKEFVSRNIKIYTDLELGMKLRDKYYIVISGSNGKTTTVSLVYHVLRNIEDVVLCGNIGYSFCKALVENKKAKIFIVEASSFQLENTNIKPNISVLLNINPCHLDHHISFKNYVDSKINITLNQNDNDIFIYNFNDTIIKGIVRKTNAKIISFSTNSVLSKCYIFNGWIYYDNKRIVKLNKYIVEKEYLLSDYMAALSVLMGSGKIKPSKIRKYIKDFKEINYRLTKVNNFIYNDAKSTNPYSTIAALKCFNNVYLICGGYDRNENLGCLKSYLHKIKKVYAYGDTKNKIYNFMSLNNIETEVFNNLDEAFKKSLSDRINEIILFSPMFASYDNFNNYIERGNYFNELCKKYQNILEKS